MGTITFAWSFELSCGCIGYKTGERIIIDCLGVINFQLIFIYQQKYGV